MALTVTYLIYSVLKAFRSGSDTRRDRLVLWIFGGIVFSAGIALPFIAFFAPIHITRTPLFISTAIAIAALGGIGYWALIRRKALLVILSAMAIVAFTASGLTAQLAEVFYKNPDFKDVAGIQQVPELKDLPVFTQQYTSNMKTVWAVGKPLRYFDYSKINLREELPAVLIGNSPPEQWLPDSVLNQIRIVDYGVYNYYIKSSAEAHVSRIEYNEK